MENKRKIYLSPSTAHQVIENADVFGLIITPRTGIREVIKNGMEWAMDNDVYNGKFQYEKWKRQLERYLPYKDTCLFIAIPDVLYNARETLEQYGRYKEEVKEMGYKRAIVTQDGMREKDIPWEEIEAIFVGGSDKHKRGKEGGRLIRSAKERGKWVHIGRINSAKSIEKFKSANSWDGTTICFEPQMAIGIAAKVREVRMLENGRTLWDM